MNKLRGKVALITGASRGIGRAIAVELAKEGASVIINYSTDDEGAKETLEEIKSINGYGVIVKGDISAFDKCQMIVEEVLKVMGKIDILVNNAGISHIGLFMDLTEEEISRILNTNLLGAIYLTKHVLNNMISRKSGTVINISSMWGEVGASCEVLYSATKGGLNSFTKALAKEVAPSNVRVNCIAPGVIDTKMNSFLEGDEKKSLEEEIPLGRFGFPSEIGKIAVFLSSEDSSYITGQIIRADGGYI
ncbi:elongation factor P 5-aminopentanone reductase [Clostridium beijerinckii]|uniref:SDR family oxidoreductase n=1 Tax=Clostridium beijerinckii TaxID=1520 RepID=A0AAW3WE84_CLOBE|nr:SDR family oxidoreductase [Clostridium beijerinckii]MBC2459678.1 SDR family oxidoreductase [Clostridium beijerinckii]MBC2477162.1 SDR family oxidoreductase [Clostridium beijerinckii]NOV59968.1 3-oxoacyl-[acyl-carrier protein] reductase [Clostridium beijerinckii]NOV71249.1 3-oxoacyl-[acyl-carrier protein] reductase [Clostridium beijerinckii]NOW34173.1 3-oxoacyl-[acyl-carrier protein] reductase [Clostridium beijerinckii]